LREFIARKTTRRVPSAAISPCLQPEPTPIERALFQSFSAAFSLREPVPPSLETRWPQQTVDGLRAALEIGPRSSYVPNAPLGVGFPDVFRLRARTRMRVWNRRYG